MAEAKFGRPDAVSVRELHTNADTDSSPDAIHHTIGPGFHQAASGQHTHDGANSPLLLEGFTISGSKAGNVALASAIAALVKLGATDSTT